MISEKIKLLGAGLYKTIPDELTLQAIPTASELNYVSSEDFDKVMLEEILPEAIQEKINPYDLLEIDYQWINRCLRFINYGPYHTANKVYCQDCGIVDVETRVDLRSIECKPLPQGFVNDIVIGKDEFIDFQGDVHVHMLTIKEAINARKDKLFSNKVIGNQTKTYARICYMITQIGKERNLDAVSAKAFIEKSLSDADYKILDAKCHELTNYGLRAGGTCICPSCRGQATFLALIDDRFFRPTVGDLQSGRNDRSARGEENTPRD